MFYSVLGLQKIEHVIQGMPNHAPPTPVLLIINILHIYGTLAIISEPIWILYC